MDLFFRELGEGFPFVIIHGLYGASDNWVSIGRKLSGSYKVLIIDQRNHGQSPHTTEHNYIAMSNDLLDFFKSNKIEKAIVMGHSMGGKTAMHFAFNNPALVEKLIVIDIAPKSYKELLNSNREGINHQNILKAMQSVNFSNVNNRTDVDTQLRKFISSDRIRHFLLKNIKKNGVNSYGWKINLPTIIDQLDNILGGFEFIDRESYSPIDIPTLFIRGDNSDYIDDIDMKTIKKLFLRADLTTIMEAGHWLHAEQPVLFLKSLQYFLDGDSEIRV